ncbi:hypothetical protein BOX15_Mlig026408g2 [Macrostomum lignano]|uniref:Uncharacterized protein n=1 Tax=Macrostomum lignano TaxID=282301 RepID=A0A267EB65_9PLAT|nr:hypothetical protein BOX15_Mlig026408g2 [Macrostomum lignano]
MHHLAHCDHSASQASRPMSPSTQLKFLLAWGQGRNSQDSPSPLSSGHRLRSKLSNNAQLDGSASSNPRPSGRRRRSLTYVPVSAWVKDFKDEDEIDGCSMRTAGSRRSPSTGRFSAASRSASIGDRITSVSSRQSVAMPHEPMESPAPPLPPPRASRASRPAERSPPPPLPPRRAPRPAPRKTLPPLPPRKKLPPPPPPEQLLSPPMPSQTPPPTPPPKTLTPPPPARVASASAKASVAAVAVTSQRHRTNRHSSTLSQAELREVLARSASRAEAYQSIADAAPSAGASIAECSRKRRELRRPSDVATLLHEILAGRASRLGAGETLEVASPAAGAASAKTNKSTHGSGAGRALKNEDDLNKQRKKWYKKSTKSRSYSSESNIVDTLAEIIAEKISRADRRRQKYDSKGDERLKFAASSSNHHKDKPDCVPGTERKVIKVKRHSKRTSTATDSSLSRQQQNCNNCYEKPPRRKTRQFCHTHVVNIQSANGVHSRSGDGWNFASKYGSQELFRKCGLSNRSNAGNYRPCDQLFFDGSFEQAQIRATATPVSERSLSERFSVERNQGELVYQNVDNIGTSTCSTDEEISSEQRPTNVSQLSTQALYHHRFSGAEISSFSRSSDSSQRSMSEAQANSHLAPTGCQNSKAVTERLSRRENSDFESQAAAAAAAYAEDLFSGVVNGRDESNLLLPLDEAPHELRLNWVLADTGDELGGGDCVDIEATIHILEPETALPRTNRRERSPVFCASQTCNWSSDLPNNCRSDVAADTLQHSQTRSSISSDALQEKFRLPSTSHGQQQNVSDWLTTGCESFNRVAKSVNKKRTTLHRRSRVQIVEPLAVAVQHKIELPSCIFEQIFCSWRPLKHAQLFRQSLAFVSLEKMLPDSASESASLLTHFGGLLIRADNRIPAEPERKISTNRAIAFRFARCISSRIVKRLIVSCCLLGSTLELAGGHLNLSMLNTTQHPEAAIVRSSLCLHQRCGNRQKLFNSGVEQTWPPCCFYRTESCRGSTARRGRSNELLEKLQVASNLAIQSRRQSDRFSNDLDEQAIEFNNCDVTPLTSIGATDCAKCLKPIEASLTEKCKRLSSKYCSLQCVITHCPELVTNLNLHLASDTEASKKDSKTLQREPPQQPYFSNQETASSESSSTDTSLRTLGNQFNQVSDTCRKLLSQAAGDKLASSSADQLLSLQSIQTADSDPRVEQANEGVRSSPLDARSCSSRSCPSSSNARCFGSPYLSELEQEVPPLVSITCQLSLVEQTTSDADTSDSFEHSLPAGDCA